MARTQPGRPGGGARSLRVGESLRHALAALLARGEVRDPALRDVPITISEVRVSPDLRNATVFVLPLGGERSEEVLEALRRAQPFLRGEVARTVQLRHAPRLSFQADRSFDRAAALDALLRRPEVARDLVDGEGDEGDVPGAEGDDPGRS